MRGDDDPTRCNPACSAESLIPDVLIELRWFSDAKARYSSNGTWQLHTVCDAQFLLEKTSAKSFDVDDGRPIQLCWCELPAMATSERKDRHMMPVESVDATDL